MLADAAIDDGREAFDAFERWLLDNGAKFPKVGLTVSFSSLDIISCPVSHRIGIVI
jgi:hypothetical protein